MEFFTQLQPYSDYGVLVLRVVIGVIFLAHGTAKLAMWKMQPGTHGMSAGMLNMMRFLSIVEPLGGLAVGFGFLTPLAALGLGIIMLGAIYFKITAWKSPFMVMEKPGWEFDLLILAGAIFLLINGAGAISIDALWFGPSPGT